MFVKKRFPIDRVGLTLLFLTLFLAISIFWTSASISELIDGLSRYRKLLFPIAIVVLFAGCLNNARQMMNYFVAACVFSAGIVLASRFGILEFLIGQPGPDGWLITYNEEVIFRIGDSNRPSFGRNYITLGCFYVVSVNILIGRIVNIWADNCNRIKILTLIISVLLLLLAVMQLMGRTGYVLVLVAIFCWGYYFARARAKLQISQWGLLAALLIYLIIAFWSGPALDRSAEVFGDIKSYQAGSHHVSQAERLHYWKVGLEAFTLSPYFGNGVGSYPIEYKKLVGLSTNDPNHYQPHSEMILLLVQGGFLALSLYLAAIYQICSSPSKNPIEFSIQCSIFGMLVNGIFNSVIWDAGEGHLFMILVGVFMVEKYYLSSAGTQHA